MYESACLTGMQHAEETARLRWVLPSTVPTSRCGRSKLINTFHQRAYVCMYVHHSRASMYACVYVYACMCIHMYACMCIVYVYVHTCIHVYMHVYMYTHMYAYQNYGISHTKTRVLRSCMVGTRDSRAVEPCQAKRQCST